MSGQSEGRTELREEGSTLLPFLPLLYVAWADGSMELAELRAICGRVLDVWKLDAEERAMAVRLLDPDRPPSRLELDSILRRIRDSAATLSVEDRRSLTELGLALARAGGGRVSEAERTALHEIESALGGSDSDAAREVLTAEPTDE